MGEDLGVVDEAVDGGGRGGRIGEDGRPLAERQVGRDRETPALVAAADDPEGEIGAAWAAFWAIMVFQPLGGHQDDVAGLREEVEAEGGFDGRPVDALSLPRAMAQGCGAK